ncbi:unnamed protein product [Diabrotica balteata]|uniref:C2H2-type domain-containing protein n=1 Tax=Diabrotica balteata TaxID=107213 RepID=A0A9N9XCT2_DIABA|nr:unnamed protein product [Diabrotica balteata]
MDYCSICLDSKGCTIRFSDLDENNVNWSTKLKSIVSDLEDTPGEHFICEGCTKKVDDLLSFKKKLENLVKRFKTIYKEENESETKYNIDEDQCSLSPALCDYKDNDDVEFDDEVLTARIERLDNGSLESTNSIKGETEAKIVKVNESCICLICDEEFESKKALRFHRKTCTRNPKGVYTCFTCNKSYSTKTNLKLHHRKCGKITILEDENTDKLLKKHGKKSSRSYTCDSCDKVFNLVKDLMAHCKSVHDMEERMVKPYSCKQCTQRFRTYAGYDQHLKYHSRKRDNVCSLCGKRFITKSELIVHEYTHFNRRNYKCTACGKAYNTNKNLKTHILVVHTDRAAWKYACGICEKRFPQKGNYDQHMKRHAGDKQHICHICQKPFITSSELKRHVSLHSNVKAFTCEYCQREYKTIRTLNTHLRRSHSVGDRLPEKEKRYVCHICPSQFYDKQKLSRHLYCHSGIKPFPCTACDKKFTDKSYLKHHMKVAHNITEVSSEIKYEASDALKYEVPEQVRF